MEVKWIALMVIGCTAFASIGGAINGVAVENSKAECYKAYAVAVQAKVEPPKCPQR